MSDELFIIELRSLPGWSNDPSRRLALALKEIGRRHGFQTRDYTSGTIDAGRIKTPPYAKSAKARPVVAAMLKRAAEANCEPLAGVVEEEIEVY